MRFCHLQVIDQDTETGEKCEESDNQNENDSVDEGEAVDGCWYEEEREDEVEDGEPLVLLHLAPKCLCHKEWPSHEGKRIEDQQAGDVEDGVAERQLQSSPCFLGSK